MASRILITHGTRPFAQRVGKLLRDRYEVRFGSADDVPHVLLQTGNYIQFPGVDTAAFEHELLRTCLDNHIDAVVPLGEKEMGLLARAQLLFAEYSIAIWMPDGGYLGGLNLLRNPERQWPLVVLDHGVAVAGAQLEEQPTALSGVFTRPSPTEALALCCIAG
ncbi:hypothetical protein [Parapedobacter sp. 10938]|uniref:hypothetical protein n=1 Tax=Parapedobacter flavus TaxID=3110225 RepID=UPI002DBE80D1|nr:hypothetical protein [Parapedobacter sp. 10938]MEC3881420.1 hypothetical protein [Parapedobacter sp. 10938]